MAYGESISSEVALDQVLPGQPYGEPDGPEIEVPYIGMTGTFLSERKDLLEQRSQKNLTTLMHHVPLNMRGPYKLNSFPGILGEREGAAGYAMCTSEVNPLNRRVLKDLPEGETRLCRAKAINRSGKCSRHGGMLHPLDRKRIDWDEAPREIRFKYGRLPVEELDDEELSRGQIRKANGDFTDNKHVSIEIHDAMVKRLFERADTKLRENLLTAVDTMAEIAGSSAVEPADRIKAATWIYERLRGKVPTEVKVTQDKPFEVVLGAVLEGGSRAASRARRGVASEDELAALDDVAEAEVVDIVDETVERYDGEDPETAEAERLAAEEEERRRFIEQPVALNTPFGPNTVPPEDPELRATYENKAEEERARVEAEKKAFAEKVNKARAARYAARSRGLTSVEDAPYVIDWLEESPEDGPRASKIIWKAPEDTKVPREELRKQRKNRYEE